MKQQIVLIACLCSAVLVYGLPISDNEKELDIINIPLNNGKELDVLTLGDSATMSERNKRTIGILRDLFPEISKQVEDQVNKLVAQILRSVGPTVLRTAIQGNANAGGGTRARADFDADFDDDDTIAPDDDATSGTRVKIELPTFDGSTDDDDSKSTTTAKSTDDAENETKLHADGDNSIDLNALNQQLEETIRVARQANLADNDASVNSNQVTNTAASKTPSANDQQASESKAPAIDELTLDSLEDADGEDRNKRQGLLSGAFGSSSGGGGAGGGANAGSGNFLFDIIRQTANRAATAVGTMYNYVAGGTDTRTTDNYDKTRSYTFTNYDISPDRNGPLHSIQHNNIDRMARTINNGLFSGSVQSQPGGGDNRATDGAAEVDEDGEPKPADVNDGYVEGIPGPVTRLVVLANRGIANLIQDLILRVASTSERLVNFKARLITALI